MADEKISELAALGTPDDSDLLTAVDVSDTSMAASGTNKKLTVSDLATKVNEALDAHIADGTAAHAASAVSVTPAGNIAAVNVQTAIQELDTEKSPTSHNHDAAYDPIGAAATVAASLTAHEGASDPHPQYQRESEKGSAGGYASLDGGGQIPAAQIPAIAITEYLGQVASQVAMLALSGQKGDWAVRTDTGTVWVITGNDPTQIGSWTELTYPAAPVSSVAGRTGAVTLTSSDLTDTTPAGRALLDDADAAAQRATLGLGTAAVEAAIAFAQASRTITAGNGLGGGGDLSADRTVSVNVDDATIEISSDSLRLKDGGTTYSKIQNVSATQRLLARKTSGAGSVEESTLSEVLDFIGSAARGDLLYRGASSWDRLGAGTNGHYLKTQGAGADPTWAAVSATVGIDINTQSTNYSLLATDRGDLIDVDTAGATISLLAAATAGDEFYCYIRYRGAATGVLVVDGNSAETIDGLATITMYSGEVRLLICTGTAWVTVLVAGGYAQFTTSGNFIVPSRARGCIAQAIGAGGGGGGGRGSTAGSLRCGGGGAGGGAISERQFSAADLGSAGTTITVTVAAQTSAAGGGSGADGTTGSPGGTSTFGSLLSGYGGGAGRGGRNVGVCGGGGGGTGGTGQNGDTTGAGGGLPGPQTVGVSVTGGAGAGSQNGSGAGRCAEYGGASGGGCVNTTAVSTEGGRSLAGGGGGGGGGGVTSGDAETAGAAGGDSGDVTGVSGGGGALGAVNGGAGTAGDAGTLGKCGDGGGGGGGQDSGTGGAGGDGGAPGGGGGGGGGGTTTGGAGGRGGRGEVRVWFW